MRNMSSQFIDVINTQNWSTKLPKDTLQDDRYKPELNFDNNERDVKMDDAISKQEDNDDLFDNPSPKKEENEDFNDDPFAEEFSKNDPKNESDDDLFGNAGENKENKSDKDFDDDPFAENLGKEESKESNKNKKNSEKVNEDIGDVFTKQLNFVIPGENKDKDNQKPKKYFGELKDAKSISQVKLENYQASKKVQEFQKKAIFGLEKKLDFDGKKTYVEHLKHEDASNKTLAESKIFSKIGLYHFQNKICEAPMKLQPLQPNNYSTKNWNNKNEKLSLSLALNKTRKDLNYEFNENMDMHYEKDIKEYTDKNVKNKEGERAGYELQEDDKIEGIHKQALAEDIHAAFESTEIDETSSIDSDTKEEEKKFQQISGVISSEFETNLTNF